MASFLILIRRIFLLMAVPAVMAFPAAAAAPVSSKPNILWITAEDMGPHLGCYGFDYANTPNLDAFAARSLRYRKCWSNAPVCAPARTTLITGMYPTSLGAGHMRSEVALPASFKLYPQFLREAGYYCTNNEKTDYNLPPTPDLWNKSSRTAHYRNRAAGQPFFAIFNLTITHESQIRKRPHRAVHDPARVPLPAYHPDTPEVRQDWAQYHDKISTMDRQAGQLLEQLKADGLADDTIVFFYGDHGSGMPRSKRWPYNSGLHVPLIIHIPEKWRSLTPDDYTAGGWSNRLVSFVDFAPTLLSLAGIKPPDYFQGHAFLGAEAAAPQKYLFGFRDRMDERTDLVRSLTDGRFVYIRNYLPHLIYGQHLNYMFETPTTRIWKALYDDNRLTPPRTFFWEPKPPEELYDLDSDPDEVRNLALNPDQAARITGFRKTLKSHLLKTRDTGFLPEPELHQRTNGSAHGAAQGSASGSAPAVIYDMAQDPEKYPIETILAAAEAASLPPGRDVDYAGGLRSPEPAIRYWTVIAIRLAGPETGAQLLPSLRPLLSDPSPSVAVAAAGLLAMTGNPDDFSAALQKLKQLSSVPANGPHVSLTALEVIDSLGRKTGDLTEFLTKLEVSSPATPPRFRPYAARLRQDLLEHQTPAKETPEPPAKPGQ